jgi:SPX domain protein involved in polyphosphate accumulation
VRSYAKRAGYQIPGDRLVMCSLDRAWGDVSEPYRRPNLMVEKSKIKMSRPK